MQTTMDNINCATYDILGILSPKMPLVKSPAFSFAAKKYVCRDVCCVYV